MVHPAFALLEIREKLEAAITAFAAGQTNKGLLSLTTALMQIHDQLNEMHDHLDEVQGRQTLFIEP